ncbi:MAG: LysR family transcriptional regulator [Candidatus Protistobacter heckmanni]|nr:LysR family transcriptional regulator [Candidatus Protistobacter heckmanni]
MSTSARKPVRPKPAPPRLLVYLDAVVRAGSIRKAAEQLHIASTALNRRILNLEAELGTPLFERLPGGVRLTAGGEIYMGYVHRSLADLESATSQIEQLRGLMRGEVRIAAAESAGVSLLPRLVAAFQARHPGVRFRIRLGGTESLMPVLLEDAADLLLAHDPPQSEALERLAEIRQPLCAILRANHPLAARQSLRLADCAPYPVALGEESFGGRKLIEQALLKSRFKLDVALVASSVETMKAYTRETGAISFQFALGAAGPERGLVCVPLSDRALANSRLVLAARRGRSLPIAAQSFAESLRQALREYAG